MSKNGACGSAMLIVASTSIGVLIGIGWMGFGIESYRVLKADTAPADSSREKNDALQIIQSADVMVIPSTDGRALFGFGDQGGGWDKYELPAGARAVPVLSQSTVGLMLEGDNMTELAAFSRETGRWHRCRLERPTSASIKPAVATEIVLVWLDGYAYAFSTKKGEWDVTPCKSQPEMNSDRVIFTDDEHVAVFSADTARWAVLKKDELNPRPSP